MDQEETTQPLHIPSNHYATAYKSTWTIPESGILDVEDIALLQHLNCSYLSSGRPPTLLALKQHAHSLTNLIRRLAPSCSTAPIDGENATDMGMDFYKDEAFDWLNKLDEPYENHDPSHHEPLWAIANTVKAESETEGIEQHCPLSVLSESGSSPDWRRPRMTHHDLVMHANQCLEILDHEYSSTGGLMSILPISAEDDSGLPKSQLTAARNTLLGQWLLHHQHLVGRMHELEISYANALDLLAGEAQVPLQLMRRSGTDGISGGREIVYPQDKFVLANVGDDVTSYLHRLIDRAEAQIEQKEKIWKASGVSGERMWRERGGKWYAQGLVPVDVMTRFYRIKGKGNQSPIFVLPAVEDHPGVQQTRRIEERPTVVSVVTPTWPERVSNWEVKYKDRLGLFSKVDTENQALVREKLEMRDVMAVKDAELRRQRDELAFYEQTLPNGEMERQRALLSEITAYKTTMEELKQRLPSEYHRLLNVGGDQRRARTAA
ncbi:hypothetical protein FZEAL_4103 [Fusarium zealandicum]|uniref:Uncharacterized protein n=1 Tax=Fusarium zealandicum TaxID=1053134 RepID=A0A8H4UN06_9HYPO|nr:hypothetical protein FZEAL_4103 [Fusarium zealandicum]